MGQRRPRPTREHSRQPAPVTRQPIMANGVHTLVQPAQPARSHPLRNPAIAEPDIAQLRTRNHARLPLRELSQQG